MFLGIKSHSINEPSQGVIRSQSRGSRQSPERGSNGDSFVHNFQTRDSKYSGISPIELLGFEKSHAIKKNLETIKQIINSKRRTARTHFRVSRLSPFPLSDFKSQNKNNSLMMKKFEYSNEFKRLHAKKTENEITFLPQLPNSKKSRNPLKFPEKALSYKEIYSTEKLFGITSKRKPKSKRSLRFLEEKRHRNREILSLVHERNKDPYLHNLHTARYEKVHLQNKLVKLIKPREHMLVKPSSSLSYKEAQNNITPESKLKLKGKIKILNLLHNQKQFSRNLPIQGISNNHFSFAF
jgi:hypothetical protein